MHKVIIKISITLSLIVPTLLGSIVLANESALVGKVTSTIDGVMEGVAVIAQQEGSNVLTSVMTNASGEYRFTKSRLDMGIYDINIRAVGYELQRRGKVTISLADQQLIELDLILNPVTSQAELASQLTNLEWIKSIPGTDQQKDMLVRNVVNCGFCHTLERITRSTHTADDFLHVIQRMMRYDFDHTSADRMQMDYPEQPIEGLHYNGFDARELAEYLASINLSEGRAIWEYPLQTLPRPTGKENEAVVTVYPIPRQPSIIHDLDVDSKGNVWYGNTGWDFIGKLDSKTGEFSEWPAPNFLPKKNDGSSRRLGVMDIQVDLNDNVWASVAGNKMAMFNTKTEKWSVFDMPISSEVSFFISPFRTKNNTVWTTGHIKECGWQHESSASISFKHTEWKSGRGLPSF